MVLSEVSSPPSAWDTESNPSSTPDASDTTVPGNPQNPQQYRYAISISSLPKPIPLLGPLTGFTKAQLLTFISLDVQRCQAIVNRRLTQPEVDAISFHCAKLQQISSYGYPLGLAGGMWRFHTTRKEWRFPFWKPDLDPAYTSGPNTTATTPPPPPSAEPSNAHPNATPDPKQEPFKINPRRFGPWLAGAQAEFAWSLLRGTAYASLGMGIGGALLAAYATTVAATGQRVDERMKEIYSTLREIGPDESRRRRLEQARGRRTPVQPGPAQDQAYNTDDGNSPASSSENTSSFPNSQMDTSDRRAQTTPQPSRGFYDDAFDDASPTAGNEPLAPLEKSSSTTPENAWERLRRGAGPVPVQPARQQPVQPKSQAPDAWAGLRGRGAGTSGDGAQDAGGDSFAFSRSEEERQLARAEAQREFDGKVERERRGEDFGGEGRRWR